MIINLPTYAKKNEAIICTRVGRDHYFYGAYGLSDANNIAHDMRRKGQDVSVFRVAEIQDSFK